MLFIKMQSHDTLLHLEISLIICCCGSNFISKFHIIHSLSPIIEHWALSNDTVKELKGNYILLKNPIKIYCSKVK